MRESLAFDDVLLVPSFSDVLPSDVSLKTHLTNSIILNTPFMSAAMDSVTGANMGIAMAQSGGIGCIHRNMSIKDQVDEVRKVKKFEAGMVVDPVTIGPEQRLSDALLLMKDHSISGIPVVDNNGILLGILTNRDVRFAVDQEQKINNLMTSKNLITAKDGISMSDAQMLLHQHKIEKLVIVDDNYRCVGLITVKDIQKSEEYPDSVKDSRGRLIVSAAISVNDDERAFALCAEGCDVLVIDTSHGHTKGVIDAVRRLKDNKLSAQIIAGNVATIHGSMALFEAGADAVKVGIGPGSICTTRIVAGVGVPQFTAVQDASSVPIPVIADGGIRYSGDVAKAIGAGARLVMVGSLLAGTDEAPGEIFLHQGRSYKSYRGMGSVAAMSSGSAERYFQNSNSAINKLIPQGVEGQVPHRGSVHEVLRQLAGGLRAAMGYIGARDIKSFQEKAEFIKITGAGLRESHAHDVTIVRESPNYPLNRE